jgi:hypothetical protein
LVAINRLTLVLIFSILFLGCSLGESDLEKAAKEFRTLHGGNWGVVDISHADRFGEAIISVRFVSKEDYENLKASLSNDFKGFPVRFTGPIWGIGGLAPDSADTQTLANWVHTPPYNVSGTPANKEMKALADKVEATDSTIWFSMDKKARKTFVADWIQKERAKGLNYSNCGDKFLRPD